MDHFNSYFILNGVVCLVYMIVAIALMVINRKK